MKTTTICSSFSFALKSLLHINIYWKYSAISFLPIKCGDVNLTGSGFLNIAFYFRNDDSSCIEEESLCHMLWLSSIIFQKVLLLSQN